MPTTQGGEEKRVELNANSASNTDIKPSKSKQKGKQRDAAVPFHKLFAYAGPLESFLTILGLLGAIISGASLPAFTIILGNLVDEGFGQEVDFDPVILAFVYLSIINLLGSYVQMSATQTSGNMQINKLRRAYLRAVLSQEPAYFEGDTDKATGAIISSFTSDANTLQEAIGTKLGTFTQHAATFVVGLGVGFYQGWKLTLVICATLPLLAGAGYLMTALVARIAKKSEKAFREGGSIASEALTLVRTVYSFNAQGQCNSKFSECLDRARRLTRSQASVEAAGTSSPTLLIGLVYAFALWYGSTLVLDGSYTSGEVLNVLFAIIIAGFSVGNAAPALMGVTKGRSAAKALYSVIQREPEIKDGEDATKIDSLKGEITFDGVTFSYPHKPEMPVLSEVTMNVPAGSTVGLVGESGSGKSTLVQLLERFYEPTRGKVKIDGKDVKTLKLKWVREQIGLISQEPALFSATIYENIRGGRDVTEKEVEDAAKKANAHRFIMRLPSQYNTKMGEGGSGLSGGQRQRIAIARAVLKKPKIMALDEATSALDSKSEKAVQDALDRVTEERSSLVIAHRLSTIRHADKIYVLGEGRVIEEGTDDELVASQGKFHGMLLAQGHSVDGSQAGGGDAMGSVDELDEDINPSANVLEGSADTGGAKESTKGAKKSKKEPKDGNQTPKAGFGRLYSYITMDRPFLWLGLTGALLEGGGFPLFGLALSRFISVFGTVTDESKFKDKVMMWSLVFVATGLGLFLGGLAKKTGLGIVGSVLAMTVRQELFASYLKQEIGWFDKEENATGALVSRLENDAAYIRGAISERMSIILQNASTVICGLIIAFEASWRLTLVVLALLPFLIASQAIHMKFLTGAGGDDSYAKAAAQASDAVRNLKAVQAFNLEAQMASLYAEQERPALRKEVKESQINGASFGFSTFMQFITYAVAFYAGGEFTKRGYVEFGDVFQSFFGIMFIGIGIAQAATEAPALSKAPMAIRNVFSVIDREPGNADTPSSFRPGGTQGTVSIENLRFSYPERSQVEVLRGISLHVPAGATVALVGESGSGKSSIMQLLQRFYVPNEGDIKLDGLSIMDIEVNTLRDKMAVVSQEPNLFSDSIEQNIRLGKPSASFDEVVDAAKRANAHSFIEKQVEGYKCQVGESGTNLSGGQKQRIAIARALLKGSRCLLLDEATSALDSDSEAVVMDALEKAMEGTTTVIVAHRLSTIQKADKIHVLSDGLELESGTHRELLQRGGDYARMFELQTRRR